MAATHKPGRPLTAAFVRSVTRPGTYGDGRGGFGLTLRVRKMKSGRTSKFWTQRVRIGGTVTNIGMGSFPRVRLAEARAAALANVREIDAGRDPRKGRGIPTFEDAARQTIELRAKGWRSPETARRWAASLERYAGPVVGSKKIDTISPADVVRILAPIWAEKPAAARVVRERLAAVFAHAVGQDWVAKSPVPVAVASLPKQNGTNGNGNGNGGTVNHRAMTPDAARKTLRLLDDAAGFWSVPAAIRFAALTAARLAEVRGATWSEIDTVSAVWTIPADRMKAGREHRVPLSPAALEVLAEARQHADGGALIFPNSRGGPMAGNTPARLLRKLGAPGTPHGFRGSFRSWTADNGVSREVAETCLAHQVGSKIERAYQRSDLLERRRGVLERWAAFLAD